MKRLTLPTMRVWPAVVVAFAMLATMFPLLSFFVQSLKSRVDMMAPSRTWSFVPTLDNYRNLLGVGLSSSSSPDAAVRYVAALSQSLEIALLATCFSLLLGGPAGFAIGRSQLKRLDAVGILAMFVLPPAAVAISLLPWAAKLGLYDNTIGLAVVHSAIATPIVIIILAGQPYGLLGRVIETAQLDGLSSVGLIRRVAIPFLAAPILAAALMAFLASYCEFFFSLVLTGSHVNTLPVMLAGFQTLREVQWGLVSAGSAVAVAPILAVAALLGLNDRLRSALKLRFSA